MFVYLSFVLDYLSRFVNQIIFFLHINMSCCFDYSVNVDKWYMKHELNGFVRLVFTYFIEQELILISLTRQSLNTLRLHFS
jgi:hypothetical protein